MIELGKILDRNPRAAVQIERTHEALANIKLLRQNGFARGPSLNDPREGKINLDDLKAASAGRKAVRSSNGYP